MSLILRFAVPLFIGNVFQQLYNMVDAVIVGRFSFQGTAAVLALLVRIFRNLVGNADRMDAFPADRSDPVSFGKMEGKNVCGILRKR